MTDPWTIIGWAVVGLLAFYVVFGSILIIVADRRRREAIAEKERRGDRQRARPRDRFKL